MKGAGRPDVLEGDAGGPVHPPYGLGVLRLVDADAAGAVAGDVRAEPGDVVDGQTRRHLVGHRTPLTQVDRRVEPLLDHDHRHLPPPLSSGPSQPRALTRPSASRRSSTTWWGS